MKDYDTNFYRIPGNYFVFRSLIKPVKKILSSFPGPRYRYLALMNDRLHA
jgi:hypothetical protein